MKKATNYANPNPNPNLRIGDLLEVERKRLAPLIGVVKPVLDCGCWGLSNCVSERCGGASKKIEANNDLLIKARPRRISDAERDSRELVTNLGTPYIL